jgi:hypothetical protein
MVTSDSPRQRALLLILGLGCLVLATWLVLRWDVGGSQRAAVVEGVRAIGDERGEDRALRPAPPAEDRQAIRGGVAIEEHSPVAEPATSSSLSPLDYGVTGSVRCRGEWLFGRVAGTVRAVNAEGAVSSDECTRSFQLFGLEPGWWVIEVDLGANGRVECSVVLTEEQPEVELDLWIERAPGHAIEVELRAAKPDPSYDRRPRGSALLVVGHDAAVGGPRTTFDSLEPSCYSSAGMASRRTSSEMWGTAKLFLPEDRSMTLSLFRNGLWVASRERSVGEDRIEWQLTSEQWSPPAGVLEVKTVDARSGAVLDQFIRSIDWRGEPMRGEDSKSTRFEDVPPGWRQVEVVGGLYERARRWVFVPPAGEAHVTIRLRPAIELVGIVTDQDGDPAMVTLACWRALEGGLVDPQSYRSCRSRPDGEFRFTNLAPGRYLIRSVDEEQLGGPSTVVGEFVASRFLEVRARASQRRLRLRLEPVSKLLLARSQPIRGALEWSIDDSAGRQLRSGELMGLAPHAVRLPPGRYELKVVGDGRDSFSQWIDLRAEPLRIDL